MSLTAQQSAALKADILADATLSALPNDPDSCAAIAAAYNQAASPAFTVWKSWVNENDLETTPGVDAANGGAATTWSWTAYIARSVGEQNGWMRLMRQGGANPSLANVRQAISDIFSGSTNSAPAQRNHLTVLSKRPATRAEKLFATGTGSYASPATLVFEGALAYSDVQQARKLTTRTVLKRLS